MDEAQKPIKAQTATDLSPGQGGRGTLVLYSNRLVHVPSKIVTWAPAVGGVAITLLSFALSGAGPGALGAIVGVGLGSLVGGAMAKRRAIRIIASGISQPVDIALRSIVRVTPRVVTTRSGKTRTRGLVVSTADGIDYAFAVRYRPWCTALASAMNMAGQNVRESPEGLAIA